MGRTFELRDVGGLEIATRSGRVLIIAEPDRANIEVDGLLDRSKKRRVWREGGRLHIRSGRGSNALTIRCPAGTDLTAASHSGRVELRGDLGDVRLFTHSGQIQVERARSVEARSTSGRISIEQVHGRAAASVVSGAVDIRQAHSARVGSVSGSLNLHEIQGKVDAMSVNGSVKINTAGAGDIRVGTVSGNVNIRVPRQRRPSVRARRKSGSLKVNCETGDDLAINVATVSGSVSVGNPRG